MPRLREESVKAFIGGSWIVLANLTVSLAGLAFWLVMPRLIGMRSLGEASEIISSAMLATTLVSAGLPLAVIREVAELREEGYIAGALLGLGLGVLAGFLADGLAGLLGYGGRYIVVFLLAFLGVASLSLLQGLVGLERYSVFFKASVAASLAKLGVGAVLGLAGYGVMAALLGYVSHPLLLFLVLAPLALKAVETLRQAGRVRVAYAVRRLLSLAASNYPQAVSLQLMTVLSIYLFALLVGRPVSTGALYVSMMAVLALSMIPNALMTAALPVSVETGEEGVIRDQLRIGLGASTPLVAFFVAAPRLALGLVKPELAEIADKAFLVMLLSVAPLVGIQAAVNILNKRRDEKTLLVIGGLRLLVLVAAIALLARPLGIEGAAIAFLAANLAALPLALRVVAAGSWIVLLSWMLQVAPAPLYLLGLGPRGELVAGLLASALASIVMHLSSILRLREALGLVRLFASSLLSMQKRGQG